MTIGDVRLGVTLWDLLQDDGEDRADHEADGDKEELDAELEGARNNPRGLGLSFDQIARGSHCTTTRGDQGHLAGS